MVAGAPDDPGVYALWKHDEVIYYGHASGGKATIQSRLKDHIAGRDPQVARTAFIEDPGDSSPAGCDGKLGGKGSVQITVYGRSGRIGPESSVECQ